MTVLRRIALAGLIAWAVPSADAAEVPVPAAGGAQLTIYSDGWALVRERRVLPLQPGLNQVSFPGVSHTIVPESVLLRPMGDAAGIRVVSRTFDRSVATLPGLLKQALGREVWVSRTNPASGAVERRRATLLSVQDGILVSSEGRIESVDPSAIAIDAESVPDAMRHEPTLVATIEAAAAAHQEFELGYLSAAIGWQADYVIVMSGDASVEIEALATVSNGSGVDFPEAGLAFVAGEVHRVTPVPLPRPLERAAMATQSFAGMKADMPAEPMAASHLYRFDGAVDLGADQTRQLSLFGRRTATAERRYVIEPQPVPFHARQGEARQGSATLQLVLDNESDSGLGLPLPAGIARVYRQDARGDLQFQGEDRLGHTAVGGEAVLTLGRDVDLPFERVQKSFRRVSDDVSESAYEITVRNAKDQPVRVTVKEAVPGDWEILEENVPHSREDARTPTWSLEVSPDDKAVLHYRLRVRS